jgi:hypothetical protein
MIRSVWSLLLASVVLPPVGIIFLWLRPRARILTKLAGSALIAGWFVAWLMLFFGLRFQLDGSGVRPLPTFENRVAHDAELERSRASQTVTPAVEAAAPVAPKKIEENLSAFTGPISAVPIATADMTRPRFARTGPPADYLCCGGSRSAAGTRLL